MSNEIGSSGDFAPGQPQFRSAVAVFVGAAVGNGLAYAVLFTAGLVFLWYLVATGVPGNEVHAKAHQSTGYLLFAHILAFACLLPGGYWTARLSAKSSLRNAAFAGLIVCTLTFLAYLVPYDLPAPWWSRLVGILAPLPAFVLGAALYKRAA